MATPSIRPPGPIIARRCFGDKAASANHHPGLKLNRGAEQRPAMFSTQADVTRPMGLMQHTGTTSGLMLCVGEAGSITLWPRRFGLSATRCPAVPGRRKTASRSLAHQSAQARSRGRGNASARQECRRSVPMAAPAPRSACRSSAGPPTGPGPRSATKRRRSGSLSRSGIRTRTVGWLGCTPAATVPGRSRLAAAPRDHKAKVMLRESECSGPARARGSGCRARRDSCR